METKGRRETGEKAMTHVTLTVAIERSLADVFAFVADGTTAPRWQTALAEAHCTVPGATGLGATYQDRGVDGGQAISMRKITEYELNSCIAFTRTTELGVVVDRYTFRAVGAGTRVSIDVETQDRGKRIGTLAYGRDAANLSNLKILLEAARPSRR